MSAKGIVSKVSSDYRELRKYNGACVLISQTIIEFIGLIDSDSDEDGDGIMANTNHFFLMPVDTEDYKQAKLRLGFKDHEIAAWLTLKSAVPYYAEVFYRRKRVDDRYYSGIFRIYSPPLLYWLSTSDATEVQMSDVRERELTTKNKLSERDAILRASKELSEKHAYGL